jgi:hypothetical protein
MKMQRQGKWIATAILLGAVLAGCDQMSIAGPDRLEVNAPSEWRGKGGGPLLPGDPIEVEPMDYGLAWPD